MANKAEQIWQFLSPSGRIDLISGSEIDDIYTGDDLDQNKLALIASKDYNELEYKYRSFLDICVPYVYPVLSKQEDWIMFNSVYLKHE